MLMYKLFMVILWMKFLVQESFNPLSISANSLFLIVVKFNPLTFVKDIKYDNMEPCLNGLL